MSNGPIKNTQYICLDFGGANCTYIETSEDYFDVEDDLRSWFAEKSMSEDNAASWAAKHLTVIFDGDLDGPEKFNSITAVGVYGPNVVELDDGVPSMSGFSVYLEVEADRDLSEEELEDLFHLVIPVIQSDTATVAFTEFDDYSALLETPSDGVRPINVVWPKFEET